VFLAEKETKMIISREKLEKAFTEWDRRYRENPEEFMTVVDHLLRETPYTYGKACALYFEKLAKEV
jgi:hypothetical protein